ncbi:hypothetical protein ACO2Q2_13180 [Dyella sp. KRB-257]|uniref:hypothetical protein n=1 Tax=Dyella sp. KRB-257 TaxID=3400915 RepID=UPI003C0BE3C8
MAEKLTAYDPALALVNDEELAVFMADAFEGGGVLHAGDSTIELDIDHCLAVPLARPWRKLDL